MEVRHTPFANLGLLFANVLVFLWFDLAATENSQIIKEKYFVLHGDWPSLLEFITYQFAHADFMHLAGNMLFLWVFGGPVNAKLGDIPYLLFYITGGMFAGLMFAWQSPMDLIGASGSIAAVTTAYLVLFPRSKVTVLFITIVTVPAMWIIVFKIILWDNVLAPGMRGSGQIAHKAHLAGYVFGFVAAMMMLLFKSVARDQFDMLALVKRWTKRRQFAAVMSNPEAQARARYGRVARPSTVKEIRDPLAEQKTDLRTELSGLIEQRKTDEALSAYEKLVGLDAEQCLPADQQLSIARGFFDSNRLAQAAHAFEKFLSRYAHHSDANEVRLLLGIINVRDLQQTETGVSYLEQAIQRATSDARRALAQQWLDRAKQAPGQPT
jgi:membrane associated rhomboid family serine protease